MRTKTLPQVSRPLTVIRQAAIFCVIAALCQAIGQPTATLAADLTTSDQAEIVKGNNAFAVELYGQLRSQPGNLFFSPESISTALAMAYAGARGQTATEMASVLHFTLPPEKLHPAMAALLKDRNAEHDGYMLKEADALRGQQGYAFLPEFLTLTKDNYGAGFNTVDFKGDTEASRQKINQWVEQQTEQKIKNLIAPGVLTPETRLVLTNAIYFKGDWQTPFKKEDTKDEDFHVSLAQTVKTPMMHRTDTFNYFDDGVFEVLEIPYETNELSMVVFLPTDPNNGLATIEQYMNAASMEKWLGQLRQLRLASEVIVTMPKFKMESQFGLADTLAAMGMKQAFHRGIADFSGMASKEKMQLVGNLSISAVVHEAFAVVDEEGTEAAAGTEEGSMTVEAAPMPLDRAVFRADHPFFFLILDNKSNSILFMGRVIAPDKATTDDQATNP